jgi:hypothetical protein
MVGMRSYRVSVRLVRPYQNLSFLTAINGWNGVVGLCWLKVVGGGPVYLKTTRGFLQSRKPLNPA